LPLRLLSFLYGLGVRTRLFLYRRGFFTESQLSCKVISVGNITLGGTGKTPMVEYIAKLLSEEEMNVVILSRGYGGRMERSFGVVSDGNHILLSPEKAGDEPHMLAQRLQDVPILVGRRRDLSGQYASEHFHPHVAILDDGFQHMRVKRDVDILLVDSHNGFGNGHLFPRGPLREPFAHLNRADLFILTKVKDMSHCGEVEKRIRAHNEGAIIFHAHYAPDYVEALYRGTRFQPEYLNERRITALSGIADPAYFRYLLELLGAQVEEEVVFPDHHVYSKRDIPIIERSLHRAECAVTTEKDAAKLRRIFPSDLPIMTLAVSLRIIEGDDFRRVLLHRVMDPSK
jgi:tetraacyldisaccharide 4'-kinase